MKKILIMGLPGSGKTTLAAKLAPLLNAKWLNNDRVRKTANDWARIQNKLSNGYLNKKK